MGLDCAWEMDAGRAEMAAMANAKASVIFVSMVGLLVLKPEVASADQIGERGDYSCTCLRMGIARSSLRMGGSYQYELALRPNAAVGAPYTASRCHHGIVMNSARCNPELTRLKDPGELVIAA